MLLLALFRAVLHIFPILGPFLAPFEREAAIRANLRFETVFGSSDSWHIQRILVLDMSVTYKTIVIRHGNHAALEVPDEVLSELGTNKRAPLKVTINGYTFQTTATGVDGKCMIPFALKDREGSKTKALDEIEITLELDSGFREVELHPELATALTASKLRETFDSLTYSKRKEFSRQVNEAKADETRAKRITKVLESLSS